MVVLGSGLRIVDVAKLRCGKFRLSGTLIFWS